MSYQTAPWFTGAEAILVGASNDVGDNTLGSFRGFIVGTPGTATPPEITVYMLDGSLLTIKNVQAGLPYAIPIRGVQSVSTAMGDVWGLKG